MHENRNLLLFLIEINNMHHTRHTFYQYPGPVFGAGAAGAVFRDIGGKSLLIQLSLWIVGMGNMCLLRLRLVRLAYWQYASN